MNVEMDASALLVDDAYRILVVEDNPELLMLMNHILKSQYRVFVAKNGKEALKIVHKTPLDLIVSDVMMPEMTGLQLTHMLKEDPIYNHLPIILLTANTQEGRPGGSPPIRCRRIPHQTLPPGRPATTHRQHHRKPPSHHCRTLPAT